MPSIARITRLFVAPLCLLSVCACSHADPDKAEGDSQGSTKPPQTEKAPEPAPVDAPIEVSRTQELTLTPSELSATEGQLEYCLDCMRQASTYTYCHFDEADFKAAIGEANLDKSVTMRVKMVPKATKNSVPDDPNAPQPEGGFTHEHHDCSVEAVLSVE